MPELPEVECVRRPLAPNLAGAHVISVALLRKDILIGAQTVVWGGSLEKQLLKSDKINALARHGKNLFFEGLSGRVLCVHLGMTGQLLLLRGPMKTPVDPHIHCVWQVDGPQGRFVLCFRDPRRFGGLRLLASREAMQERIDHCMGPDALTLDEDDLASSLKKTKRSIKATLLDQTVVAGIGNIYADEALFTARIHPSTPSCQLNSTRVRRLAESIRVTLQAALDSGGSTISDYRNPLNQSGQFQHHHQVYGRSGEPCERCARSLKKIIIAQRTTVFCSRCQRVPRARKTSISNNKPL